MPDGGQSFVGVGVFTVPEAARLTGVPTASVRRWIFGDPRRNAAPALVRQLPQVEGQDALGFYNLVEVLFLRDLTRQGVSWPAIRRAAERAQEVLRDDRPLATRRIFHTDGRGLFLEVAGETGDRRLLDLLAGNYAMLEVLERLHQVPPLRRPRRARQPLAPGSRPGARRGGPGAQLRPPYR